METEEREQGGANGVDGSYVMKSAINKTRRETGE